MKATQKTIFVIMLTLIAILIFITCGKDKSTNSSSVPVAPTNLIGQVLSSSTIQLSWVDNSSNETAFLIFRSNAGVWSQVGTTSEDQSSYMDRNLLDSTAYQYYVVATNNIGNSTPSNTISLSTQQGGLFFIGGYNTTGAAQHIFVEGSYAYLAAWTSFQIINVSDPSNPILSGNFTTPSDTAQGDKGADDLFVHDGYAYVTYDHAGVRIINVSSPENPVEVGHCYTPGKAQGIHVIGNYAFVADGDKGLQVINIASQSAPIIIGSYDTPDEAIDVAVSGNYAYVADGHSGLIIINVTNPSLPSLTGIYDTPDYANDITINGNTAYVADQRSFQIVDVSSKSNPVYVGSFDLSHDPVFRSFGSTFTDGYAFINIYLSTSFMGLKIVDLSNPA